MTPCEDVRYNGRNQVISDFKKEVASLTACCKISVQNRKYSCKAELAKMEKVVAKAKPYIRILL